MKATHRLVATIIGASVLTLTSCSGLPRLPGQTATTQEAVAATAEKYSVAKGSIENTIVATGKVLPRQTNALAFTRTGQVLTVTVQSGDRVKAGQLLAALDTTDLKLTEELQRIAYVSAVAAYSQTIKGPAAADVASAKAALQSAQAQYSDLVKPPSSNDVAAQKAALENAQVALKQAQANYDRAFQRNPAGIGGSSEGVALEQATNSFKQAQANYDKAFEGAKSGSLASASAQIVAAKAKIDAMVVDDNAVMQAKAKVDQALLNWQQAQQNTQRSSIVAPYDGVVTAVNVNVGDWASTGGAAIQLMDISRPIFQVDVDEADVGNLRPGGEARITLQAFSSTPLTARIEKIAPQATVNGNVTTVKVDLAIGQPEGAGNGQPGAARAFGAGGAGEGQAGQGGQRNLPPAIATAVAQGTPAADAIQAALAARGGAQGTGQQAGAGQGGQRQQGGRAGAATRPFTATINILPGLSGTSEIIISAVHDALVVPNRALVVDRATRGFTVQRLLADGKTESVPVQVGQRGSAETQIVGGLSEGDVLVLPSATTTTPSGGGGGPGGVPGGGFIFGR